MQLTLRPWSTGTFLRVLGGAVLLLITLLFAALSVAGTIRFRKMKAKVQSELAEAEARDFSRPSLRGQAEPGNSWDDYPLALTEIKTIKSDSGAFTDYLGGSVKADRKRVEALLADHASALDHLRRGAQRASGRFPYHWEEQEVPGLTAGLHLAEMAACQARLLAEAERPREAAELLLDTCQFARDLGFNGLMISEMMGHATCGVALDELRTLSVSGKLRNGDLREVERELELLDRHFPSHVHSLSNETFSMGMSLIRLDTTSPPFILMRGLHHFLLADAFDTLDEFTRRRAAAETSPWPEVRRIELQLSAELQEIRNPVARIAVPGLLTCGRVSRERRAQLRLLRTAVHFLESGEVLVLDDPLGSKIQTHRSGKTLKVWSIGREGKDHGGVGEWKPAADQDIVLEVNR